MKTGTPQTTLMTSEERADVDHITGKEEEGVPETATRGDETNEGSTPVPFEFDDSLFLH